ncbi:MAG TPA: hypothetical protein VEI26_17080 [Terriglobales bacterium]|nr:hypothetical protein [Terriglobales bacterium]
MPPEELKDKANGILVYLEESGWIEMDKAIRVKSDRKKLQRQA